MSSATVRGGVVALGLALALAGTLRPSVAQAPPADVGEGTGLILGPSPEGTGSPGHVEPASAPFDPAAVPDDPVEVTRAYLELESEGRTDESATLVDPACLEPDAALASPLELMGARLRVDSLTLHLSEVGPSRAVVDFTARGALYGESIEAPLDVFGSDVELHIDSLSIDDMTVTSTVSLVRRDDRWWVGCP